MKRNILCMLTVTALLLTACAGEGSNRPLLTVRRGEVIFRAGVPA